MSASEMNQSNKGFVYRPVNLDQDEFNFNDDADELIEILDFLTDNLKKSIEGTNESEPIEVIDLSSLDLEKYQDDSEDSENVFKHFQEMLDAIHKSPYVKKIICGSNWGDYKGLLDYYLKDSFTGESFITIIDECEDNTSKKFQEQINSSETEYNENDFDKDAQDEARYYDNLDFYVMNGYYQ